MCAQWEADNIVTGEVVHIAFSAQPGVLPYAGIPLLEVMDALSPLPSMAHIFCGYRVVRAITQMAF